MDVRHCLNRCYYSMTVSDIRMIYKLSGESISYNSVMYLDVIEYQQPCTVSSLSETLRISKPAVTQKVNELVQKGWVCKVQSETDKRVHHLTISDQIAQENTYYDRPFERAIRELKRQYTPEELALLCKMIDTFSEEFLKEE